MSLAPDDFDFVRSLVLARSGVLLEDGKEYLVESRLGPVARQTGFESIGELIRSLKAVAELDPLRVRAVEALMTGETRFFRDPPTFEMLRRQVLPDLIRLRGTTRRLRIWSAAASTGQEPYSLAMMLADDFPQLAAWDIQILASDLSEEALRRGEAGDYGELEVTRGLPEPLLQKHFRHEENRWHLEHDIQRRVDWRQINLIEPWPTLPMMDLVLLRNVLIYFERETKKRILAGIRKLLRPGGYLLLGTAETTINLDTAYEQIYFGKTVCYRPRV